jgi:hypothetical protein
MIIKIPVYLNLDEHFHPDEVSEVTETFRIGTTKLLKSMDEELTIKFLGREIIATILTTKDLEILMTGSKLGNIRKAKTRLKELKSKL